MHIQIYRSSSTPLFQVPRTSVKPLLDEVHIHFFKSSSTLLLEAPRTSVKPLLDEVRTSRKHLEKVFLTSWKVTKKPPKRPFQEVKKDLPKDVLRMFCRCCLRLGWLPPLDWDEFWMWVEFGTLLIWCEVSFRKWNVNVWKWFYWRLLMIPCTSCHFWFYWFCWELFTGWCVLSYC